MSTSNQLNVKLHYSLFIIIFYFVNASSFKLNAIKQNNSNISECLILIEISSEINPKQYILLSQPKTLILSFKLQIKWL